MNRGSTAIAAALAATLACSSAQPKLTGIEVSPSAAVVPKGARLQLHATGVYDDGSRRTVDDATWSSSDGAVATVEPSGAVLAHAEGATTVRAESGTFAGQASVTVGPPVPTSIQVEPALAQVAAGLTARFEAIGIVLTDGTVTPLADPVIWSSSAPAVASPLPDGTFESHAEGGVTVTARAIGLVGSAQLQVGPPAAVSIEVAPRAANAVRGLPARFTATAEFTDGVTRDVTASASWSITPSVLARVESGLARSTTAGAHEVRAAVGDVSGTAALSVLGTQVAFATSQAGTGNLSTWSGSGSAYGTAGADAVCGAAAAAAGLPGAFKAWLSDSQDDAYCRLHGQRGRMADRCGLATLPVGAGPWVRTDAWPFADGVGALLEGRIVAPLSLDELGRPLPADRVAWTGTGFDGAVDRVHPAPCQDWSVGGYEEGLAGHTRGTTDRWTLAQWQSCLGRSSLLCFEVGDEGAALPELAPAAGLRAFATSVFGTGNLTSWADAGMAEGVFAGDAICRARAEAVGLAGATSFKAWLASAGTDPGARFGADGPWVRLDGVPLASSRAALERGELFTALALDEFGRPVDRGVWTGSDAAGRATAETCNGWRSDLDTDLGAAGDSTHASALWTRYFDPVSCLAQLGLYCLEDSGAP